MSAQLLFADVPPGNPEEYEHEVVPRDGRHIFVRPVVPAYWRDIGDTIAAADAEMLGLRVMGGARCVTPALLTRLSTVEYVRRFALVGRVPVTGRLVAVARYERVAQGVAEVSSVVAPGAGLGWRPS